ncbi:MAG: c-type cytochrome [Thiohalomonadales bacterium]
MYIVLKKHTIQISLQFLFICLLTYTLSGCSNSDDDAGPTTVPSIDPMAPKFIGIEEQTARVAQSFSMTIQASDANNDDIKYAAIGSAGPTGNPFSGMNPAKFAADTGIFSWTPTASQIGQYSVSFSATDDSSLKLSSEETVTIWVRTEGEYLYLRHCSSCHGSDGSTGSASIEILGSTAININNAIDSIADMKGLKNDLSESDIVNIAEHLEFRVKSPLAYVVRRVEAMITSDPRANPRVFPGGDLYLTDLHKPSRPPINITESITAAIPDVKGAGDVMSINVDYTGRRIVFALHEGLLSDFNSPPNTWDIWELNLDPSPGELALHRVISGKLLAGKGNDYDPVYLPDGRIVYTSDRQVGGQSLQAIYGLASEPGSNELRTEPALNLHIMNAVGQQIKQISYNQSDDRFPGMLHSGEIVFSRWEQAGNTEGRFDLYRVLPDGSEMKLLYGSHSHSSKVNDPNVPSTQIDVFDQVFFKPRQMSDGRLIVSLMPFSNFDPSAPSLSDATAGGGELIIIDYDNYIDVNQLKFGKTNSVQSAGHIPAIRGEDHSRFGLPLLGQFANAFPIWEPGGSSDRFLISWAPCQVFNSTEGLDTVLPCAGNESLPLASPGYGLYYLDTSDNSKVRLISPEPGLVLTDAVLMLDRTGLTDTAVNPVPVVIADKSDSGALLDQGLLDRGMGAIKIRSVYDALRLTDVGLTASQFVSTEALPCMDTGLANQPVDCDDNNPDIVVDLATLSDPLKTTADQRPVRYVRVVGAMPSLGGKQNYSYGMRGYEMRAILGYAPVEPDGSVYVEVPANVPFALELVNKDGFKFRGVISRRDRLDEQRTYQSHDNWLQVIPGETLVCNGCHEGHVGAAPLNAGAASSEPFPNTVAGMTANPQETMAETRVRYSCTMGASSCAARLLNRDLVYNDVWTDPDLRQPDANFAIEYNDRSVPGSAQGLTGNAPIYNTAATGNCQIADYTDPVSQGSWTSNCRIVINYDKHIQPLWDKPRWVDDGAGNPIDGTCTSCHSTVDASYMPQIPAGAGQLDLTSDGPQDTVSNNGNWLTSYKELLFTGLELEIVNGGLQRAVDIIVVPDPLFVDDPNNPNDAPQQIRTVHNRLLSTGPVVSPFFARESYLIEILTAKELKNSRNLPRVPTVDHSKMMTRAEIRVITEWIELGVQYYNDPGSAPWF